MNQPVKRENMRDSMPETAEFVDRKRAEWGAEHVNSCLRLAKAGEADQFYAIENGHVLGTPFSKADPALANWQDFAVIAGVKFAAFIRQPENKGHEYALKGAGSDGAH